MSWQAAGWVALGGAIGSVLRWAAIIVAVDRFGPAFPWGTIAVNVSGSFAIGVIAELALAGSWGVSPAVRLFVATGVLGGFTTFSTFSLDTVILLRDGQTMLALAYVLGSVVLGVGAAFGGIALAKLVAVHA